MSFIRFCSNKFFTAFATLQTPPQTNNACHRVRNHHDTKIVVNPKSNYSTFTFISGSGDCAETIKDLVVSASSEGETDISALAAHGTNEVTAPLYKTLKPSLLRACGVE